MPSDTTRDVRDVSLADHAKTTCALAACFYRYHAACGWTESAVKDDSFTKIILVCGDLSGIQDYIYGIASIGHGGVAKRLRGRSFRISVLTEAVALRILKALDLPMACKIIAAGGQFYLLLPNTPEAKEKLDEVRRSVSAWMLDEFLGEISVSIAKTELSGERLAQGRFDEALEEVRAEMARAKLRKYEDVIARGPKVFDVQFRGLGACPVCDRRPARPGDTREEACPDCELDATLGQRLASAESLWSVFSQTPARVNLPLFGEPAWYASLVDREDEMRRLKPFAVFSLASTTLAEGIASGFAPYAGYVARWRNEAEFNEAPRRDPDLGDQEDYSADSLNSGQAIKSLTALAGASGGSALLGVLRADVDHLGLVFTLGMRGRASLSRITTLRTLLEHLFRHRNPTPDRAGVSGHLHLLRGRRRLDADWRLG